ncbi:hypothetical protein AB0O07_01065 [Streptomyces sp. NPDC093085]|uniref:hypothetical protein n=1 Tax=Streptomyces sp. NPDC093085 TaxID=3155068 RepID=UPI00342A3C2B
MDEERAGRLVSSLRARGVPAHLAHLGVYQCGVRVVLLDGGEAVWDIDGELGLRAEVVEDGVLVGFVPHVRGSENFDEARLVEVIAGTRYDKEGLRLPAGVDAETDGADTVAGLGPAPSAPPPARLPRLPRRWPRWLRRR